MNVSLYQAAAGMKATARWQEVIAENLASSSVPGFKRQELSFNAVQTGLMGPALADPARRFAMPGLAATTDFKAGELKAAGPTDLAIEGRGFFEVQLPNGARAYTRDGEFHVNAQGQLVTKQGYPVEGTSGPIQIDPTNAAPVSVSVGGDVSQGADGKGALKIVDFKETARLDSIGGGYFLAADPALVPVPATQFSLRQGYLESSNASTVSEMADLITSSRLFEANQKVIQSQDERLARLIAEVGNPN
jgi:flagellar basal-body rod protein FlgG